MFHRCKRPVRVSWRIDGADSRVIGEWRYVYRVVDKPGQTIDVLLTEERDEQAAKRVLTKAIRRHGVPETITIDGSAAHEAAIRSDNKGHGTAIEMRQITYVNKMVEQDHRGVKRITRPLLGFTSCKATQATLVGIELMHRLTKDQLVKEARTEGFTLAEQFSSLAV